MFEDPNGGAGQASTEHQRGVVQLVTQDQTTLKTRRKEDIYFLRLCCRFFNVMISVSTPGEQ